MRSFRTLRVTSEIEEAAECRLTWIAFQEWLLIRNQSIKEYMLCADYTWIYPVRQDDFGEMKKS
ncbi:MAG: hypothetical protein HDR15_09590 [Lachnospiraceae bacterium]|nr:hypothetical protein [Lachnospiraceae bacterium]